jgi:hypothetical protein
MTKCNNTWVKAQLFFMKYPHSLYPMDENYMK